MLVIATMPLAIEGLPTTMHATNQSSLKFVDSLRLCVTMLSILILNMCSYIKAIPCKGCSTSTSNVIILLDVVMNVLQAYNLFASGDRSSSSSTSISTKVCGAKVMIVSISSMDIHLDLCSAFILGSTNNTLSYSQAFVAQGLCMDTL